MKQLILLLFFAVPVLSISCLNGKNEPVDWWVILKTPKICDNCPDSFQGLHYGYFDSKEILLKIPETDLNHPNSPLQRTLNPYAKLSQPKYGAIIWNDQPFPTGSASSTFAHSKGFSVFNKDGGFLIIHSFPQYPEYNQSYFDPLIPDNTKLNAQHMFCFTSNAENLQDYSFSLLIDRPFPLPISSIPISLASQYSNFEQIRQKAIQKSAIYDITFVFTEQTLALTKFSKTSKYLVNMYSVMVTPLLGTDMVVQSWTNGAGGKLEPNCTQENTHVFSSQYNKIGAYGWKNSKDHSKYAVSLNEKKPYVCFGDVNLMESQQKRGGGTVCFKHAKVWKIMSSIIMEMDRCPPTLSQPEQPQTLSLSYWLGFFNFA